MVRAVAFTTRSIASTSTRMMKRPLSVFARQMSRAIALVRGRKYKVQQSVGLYPAAGCSDDYAYSRHIEDSTKSKVVAFTVEWGRTRCSTPFHPPYPEMRKVMREVAAGLLEFCLRAK